MRNTVLTFILFSDYKTHSFLKYENAENYSEKESPFLSLYRSNL